MPDLSTTYMGLTLSNPIVPSASPLTKTLDQAKAIEDAGAGALVMHSLFEEQINYESSELDHYLTLGADSYAEALSYFPEASEYSLGPDQYLEQLRKIREAVKIPVIASLNGVSPGGWTAYAKKMEQAGASALELNVYFIPTDPTLSSQQIENNYVELLKSVRSTVSIPVAVKLSPFFTNLSQLAKRLDQAGANALVLFNRFYQPDIDLDKLDVIPRATLSTAETPNALRLPLRWIAILYGNVGADLALTSGVHSAADVLKGLMAGAKITMVCSELLLYGVSRIGAIKSDLLRWMTEHEYASVAQMQGSMSQKSVAFPSAFERAHYMRAITNYPVGGRS